MIDFLIGPLLKMIGFDYKNKRAKDKELLEKFLTVLPPDSDSVCMLKDQDMGERIRYSYFRSLNQVSEEWLDVDKEFQVRRIEKLKIKFIEALRSFLSEYAQRSGLDERGFISIGMKDWEDRKEMIEYKEKLNKLSADAFKKYNNFVSIARKEI